MFPCGLSIYEIKDERRLRYEEILSTNEKTGNRSTHSNNNYILPFLTYPNGEESIVIDRYGSQRDKDTVGQYITTKEYGNMDIIHIEIQRIWGGYGNSYLPIRVSNFKTKVQVFPFEKINISLSKKTYLIVRSLWYWNGWDIIEMNANLWWIPIEDWVRKKRIKKHTNSCDKKIVTI